MDTIIDEAGFIHGGPRAPRSRTEHEGDRLAEINSRFDALDKAVRSLIGAVNLQTAQQKRLNKLFDLQDALLDAYNQSGDLLEQLQAALTDLASIVTKPTTVLAAEIQAALRAHAQAPPRRRNKT